MVWVEGPGCFEEVDEEGGEGSGLVRVPVYPTIRGREEEEEEGGRAFL